MTQNGSTPIKVLYIEDDKNIQGVVSNMLSLLGYEVACADNGKLGIEKAESWLPDIVLTDLRMPVMDGSEVIRHLRSNPDTATMPIFVLSAWTDASTRSSCMQLGANRFFSKPLSIQKISSAIQAVVARDHDPKPQ